MNGCTQNQSSSQKLGDFISSLNYDDLPEATIHAVRRHTLDTLGAALAGARQPEPMAVLTAGLATLGDRGSAPIWGTHWDATPVLAALVNGTAAHALELDDASGCDHSGAVVIPAVFAALAMPGCTANEQDMVASIVAGYEIGRRVMEASGGYDGHNGAGWHSTGTCGVFAAAAAVARLLCYDASVTANALGIAGSFASGTWAFLADGAMTKRVHPGHAASAGVLAVAMSRAGLQGPRQVFEAPWGGFLRTYGGGAAKPELLLDELGRTWRIHLSSIKPFASCRGTHAAIEAIIALRNKIPPSEMTAVTIAVTPTVERMCGGRTVDTFVDAQMSLPFTAAIAAIHGCANVELFQAEYRRDPQTMAFMRKVVLDANDGLPSNVSARVSIRSQHGHTLTMMVDVPLGSAGNPLPDDGLIAKYHLLADSVLGQSGAVTLAQRIMQLGSCGSARDIPALTRRIAS
jgi:2-methylcitrate dehydratase PrpD